MADPNLPAERPRPRSLREMLQGRIVALVRGGTYPAVTATTVGVRRDTFRRWVQRGTLKPQSREGRFVHALAQAEALLETVLVQQVVAEAQTKGRIALAYLERRYPERWRKARRLGHTGPGGGPVEHRIVWDVGPAPIPVTAVPISGSGNEDRSSARSTRLDSRVTSSRSR